MALFLCVFDYCAVNFALSDLAFLSVFGFICGIGCRLEIKGRKMLRSRDASVSIIARRNTRIRSEEHTSELQSLMRISYAVFCLKIKKALRFSTYTTYTSTNLTI